MEMLIMFILGSLLYTIVFVVITLVCSFAFVIGKDAYEQMKVEIKESEEENA